MSSFKKLVSIAKSVPLDIKIKWADTLKLPYADSEQLDNIAARVLLCVSLANSIKDVQWNVNKAIKNLAEDLSKVDLNWDEIFVEIGSLDNAGELYNKVLHENRYDGSFYTLSHAAVLLAGLAMGDDDTSKFIRKAVDFSCGTGILLSALNKTTEQIELHGYDISKLAAVITDALLYLDNAHRQVYLATLGRDHRDNSNHIGSLDLLYGDGYLEFTGYSAIDNITNGMTDVPISANGVYDLAVGNSPFTRDDKRYKNLADSDQDTTTNTLHKLALKYPGMNVNNLASPFTYLADYGITTKPHGRFAYIYPMVLATGISGLGERKFIANKFDIEYIIISHDPKAINFSFGTAINEMMIIAQRVSYAKPKAVKLHRNPRNHKEAAELVRGLLTNNKALIYRYANVQQLHDISLTAGDWRFVNYYDEDLYNEYSTLLSSSGHIRLGDMVNVPSMLAVGRSEGKTFKLHQDGDEIKLPAFKFHKATWYNSLNSDTDAFVSPAHSDIDVDHYKARLFITYKARYTSGQVMSIMSKDGPVIGDLWTPIQIKPEFKDNEILLEKALCLYLNSSVGIFGCMYHSTTKKIAYRCLEKSDLLGMRVPDFSKLPKYKLTNAADAYDTIADQKLLRFRDILKDPTRIAINDAVCDLFDWDDTYVDQFNRILVNEPSISN